MNPHTARLQNRRQGFAQPCLRALICPFIIEGQPGLQRDQRDITAFAVKIGRHRPAFALLNRRHHKLNRHALAFMYPAIQAGRNRRTALSGGMSAGQEPFNAPPQIKKSAVKFRGQPGHPGHIDAFHPMRNTAHQRQLIRFLLIDQRHAIFRNAVFNEQISHPNKPIL